MDEKLVKDYVEFIDGLDAKFKFYDKDKFEDDFVLFLKKNIKKNVATDPERIEEQFFLVLRENSSLTIEQIMEMAKKELENLSVG